MRCAIQDEPQQKAARRALIDQDRTALFKKKIVDEKDSGLVLEPFLPVSLPVPGSVPVQVEKETTEKSPTAGKSGLKKLTSDLRGPSIPELMSTRSVSRDEPAATEPQVTLSGQEINESPRKVDLESCWNEFLSTIENRPNLKAALSVCPQRREDNKLEVVVYNSVQEQIVREIKPRLMEWLRMKLSNSEPDLVIRVEDRELPKLFYTDDEKLQEMARKNPALALLKQKFSLDFDGQ